MWCTFGVKHVVYMCFTCAVHELYMCSTCGVHVVYMWRTYVHVVWRGGELTVSDTDMT